MEKIDLKKRKIIVVDDEENNWFVLRDIIQFCNGEAIWAETGMEAIKIVTEDVNIALVFMDINLPFMNGVQATNEIKQIRPNLPIIIQSAFVKVKQTNDELPKCDDRIFKPINFNETISLMEKYLIKKA